MNELLFLFHLTLILALTWITCRFGRDWLLAWVVLQPILANLFVLKQMSLFGFQVTCSDMYSVSALLGMNYLQEQYGRKSAEIALKLSFSAMLFFLVMSLVHISYLPSSHDTTHDAYRMILSQTPRLFIASIASFLLVQKIDIRFFAYVKEKRSTWPLRMRNLLCLTVSQAADTLFFTIFGLAGLVTNLVDIFLVSLMIKWGVSAYLALSAPPIKKEQHA